MSKLKALIENKNKIAKEANAILDKSVEEVRALTEEENSEYEAKMTEVRSLEKTIELLEKRAEDGAEVEERKEDKPMEETREITITEEQENEIRAVEDFIKGKLTDEVRSMTTASGTGGITIPTHLYNDIVARLYEVAPLLAKARRFTPVSGTLEILRETEMGDAAFVGEMENIAAKDFTFDKVKLEQRRCGSAIELSQQLVNDSGIDIVGYAKEMLVKRLGLMLDRVVVNGQKETQFEGLLSADKAKCGVTAATSVPDNDDYRDVFNAMPLELVGGAEWIMSRAEFNRVSKLKDALGHYYMTTDVINGRPVYKYHGLPINITDAMPKLTNEADQVAAILVNMQAAYATMVKKAMEMKHITGDTTQALRGSHLLLLDIYADGKIINEQAIRLLYTGQPAQ